MRAAWCLVAVVGWVAGCQRAVPIAPSEVIIIERATTQPTVITAPAPAVAPIPRSAVIHRKATIDPFDLLEISVGDADQPQPPVADAVRVQADGSVRVSIVGRVVVAGLNKPAAEGAIADAFKTRQIIAKPTVRVYRRQSAGDPGAPTGPLRPGDLLQVVVHDLTGNGIASTVRRRVDETGRIDLPLIGPVNVVGLTDPQIADAVVLAYADHQIVAHANVSVVTLEAAPEGLTALDLPDAPIYDPAVPAAMTAGPTTRPMNAQ